MGARFSAPVQTGPEAHPATCTMGTGSFLGVKNGRGVTLTPHPLVVPWSRQSIAMPLLPLWAVRFVQSLSACTRLTFTFTFIFISYFCFTYIYLHLTEKFMQVTKLYRKYGLPLIICNHSIIRRFATRAVRKPLLTFWHRSFTFKF